MLLEPGDGSFDDVALPVAHGIDHRWPAAPSTPARPELLLVGALGDGVVIRRWRSNLRQVV
jgi:hypothetical protein